MYFFLCELGGDKDFGSGTEVIASDIRTSVAKKKGKKKGHGWLECFEDKSSKK